MRSKTVFEIGFGLEGQNANRIGQGWSAVLDGGRTNQGANSWVSMPALPPAETCFLVVRLGPGPGQSEGAAPEVSLRVGGIPLGSAIVSERTRIAFEIPPVLVWRTADCDLDLTSTGPLLVTAISVVVSGAPKVASLRSGGVDDGWVTLASTAAEVEQSIGKPVRDLMFDFCSIGDNCEFGLVQRRAGAEPLNLFRFSSTPLGAFLDGLGERFERLGEADAVSVEFGKRDAAGRRELMIEEHNYSLRYHPFVMEGEMEFPLLLRRERNRMTFLRTKFMDDVKAGDKLFVVKRDGVDEAEILALHLAIREFGAGWIFWVSREHGAARPGDVEVMRHGILRGYVDRFAPVENAHDLSYEAWIAACANASRLFARVVAPTAPGHLAHAVDELPAKEAAIRGWMVPARPAERLAIAALRMAYWSSKRLIDGVRRRAVTWRPYIDELVVSRSGSVRVRGWFVSPKRVRQIDVIVDGKEVGRAIHGIERPDVEQAGGGQPGSLHSGFSIVANADTPFKAEAIVTLRIVFDDDSRKIWRRPTPTVAAVGPVGSGAPLPEYRGTPPLLHIDEPIVATLPHSLPIWGDARIEGWSLAPDGPAAVTITVDGMPLTHAARQVRRDGLTAAHPEVPNAHLGGFSQLIPRGGLAPGPHRVRVTAKSTGGSATLEFSITFDSRQPDTDALLPRRSLPAAEQALSNMLLAAATAPPPEVVVAIACREFDPQRLRATLETLGFQSSPHWRAIILGDQNADADVSALVAESLPEVERQKVILASDIDGTAFIASLNPRDLVMPLVCGDRLAADAVLEFALAERGAANADFFYADEYRQAHASGAHLAFFKPDWSPELLLATNYVGRPWCATVNLISRLPFNILADWRVGNFDLVLRLSEISAGIHHIPGVLGSTPPIPPNEQAEEGRALSAAVSRRGLDGTIEPGLVPNSYRLKRAIGSTDRVSIIIPTSGSRDLIRTCIEGIRARTSHPNIELICIDNIEDPASPLKHWLRENADVVIDCPGAFNWSRFNNLGAAKASGNYLLFLNDDVGVVAPQWLGAMLEPMQQPAVGIVGPQLLYPDGTVQHAGMFLNPAGQGAHAFRGCAADDPGYFGLALTIRNVIAVTGAALLTKRGLFDALGGFDESHAIIKNDLDFCLKAHVEGVRCLYTPFARLTHHEKASRSHLPEQYDEKSFAARWSTKWSRGDPYFHASLDPDIDAIQPHAEPPRTIFSSRPQFLRENVRNILVVKLDHIGDFVTALPAIRRLKASFPSARITALVAPASTQLAQIEGAIDRVEEFEFFHGKSQLGEKLLGEPALQALEAKFAGERFDLAVDLRKHPETRDILRRVDATVRAGFASGGLYPWLDIGLDWHGHRPKTSVRQHIADDLINLVDAIVAAGNPDIATIERPADWSRQQATMMDELCGIGLFDRRVVCVHPGAGNEMRQWPAERFAALIDALLESEEVNVAVIGSAGEEEIVAKVMARIAPTDRVHSLLGRLKLAQLPYFLDRCTLFVGNDSGPKHIAAGLGVPTVAIHSGVIDVREFGPLGERAVAIQRDMECSPCFRGRRQDCHRNLACLEGLYLPPVLAACRRMLSLQFGVR